MSDALTMSSTASSNDDAPNRQRVLIFVVSYNAEHFIEAVLDRIPDDVVLDDSFYVEVLVIDDRSSDETFHRAIDYARSNHKLKITVLYNPENQGYGGNQKLGYHYAIVNQFDVVVLLHGDGQYPPEQIRPVIEPILAGDADAVFGSRMLSRFAALKGGMPFYKWLGNRVLTSFQNFVLRSNLSEFHSGFRAYSVRALSQVPFPVNSDYFDFDTDIIIQFLDTEKRIKEVPIPTYYGDEICRVNGLRYAALCALSSLRSRMTRLGIGYDPKYDYAGGNAVYIAKLGYQSSHQFALDHIAEGATIVDLGCGPGYVTRELARTGATIISVDREIRPMVEEFSQQTYEADLDDFDFDVRAERVDVVLALDILEHLRSPEAMLQRLRNRFSRDDPQVIVTTANIAFFPIRLGLLAGQFNYGPRGILDLTHTRLFTFRSLRRALVGAGYEVTEQRGLPAPWPLVFGDNWVARLFLFVHRFLILISKRLFSYQIAMVATLRPTLGKLLSDAERESEKKHSEARTA